jgi:hypothetical protein
VIPAALGELQAMLVEQFGIPTTKANPELIRTIPFMLSGWTLPRWKN